MDLEAIENNQLSCFVRNTIDMLWTCRDVSQIMQNSANICICHDINFLENFVCRAYQTMVWRKKYWHFSFFIPFLDSLGQAEYNAQKKEKACSEVHFLPKSLALFSFFSTCLDMLCVDANVAKFLDVATFNNSN